MKTKALLAGLALLAIAAAPAKADVILSNQLSGTGDNVIFNSLTGGLAIGSFNGQHTGFVNFTDLSGNPLFTAAANGNDIKIANTTNLSIQVFDTSLNLLATSTDVFSLKGTGTVTAFVTAIDQFGNTEPIKIFNLGAIDPNAQSGFTFTAINGEAITLLRLLDTGGNIAEFEHYRIDVAPSIAAVPVPAVGTGLPGILAGALFLFRWMRRRREGLHLPDVRSAAVAA
jgi:hypothetical protein